MGLVNQTLTYGAVNSADYGIYIGGEGVFNAPKRDTKLITIPGRNGVFAQDQGRFENIIVTYPCFYVAHDLATFAEDLAAFREAMLSQIGYQRLEDTLNPDEYREALFIDGLEVQPVRYNTVAEFELTFNCKPQRWLKVGETAQAIASGGNITNPTLFGAAPLIEAEGYGTITIADQEITILNNPYGIIYLWQTQSLDIAENTSKQLEIFNSAEEYNTLVNTGDVITLLPCSVIYTIAATALSISQESGQGTATVTQSGTTGTVAVSFPTLEFTAGTAATVSKIFMLSITTTTGNTVTKAMDISIAYDGARVFTFSRTWWVPDLGYHLNAAKPPFSLGTCAVDSTATPDVSIIIDTEIGFAEYSDGTDANSNVIMPAELIKLGPGANAITYESTITDFSITPRWWRV